jgi:hypothetical protein
MRLWGVALVAHVVANWAQPDLPTPVGLANLVVGLLGVGLVFAPQPRLLLFAALATIVSLLSEMPFTGNHWLIAGIISVATILVGTAPHYLFPAGRLVLLVFYFYAAFAKLNSGFFDPEVSCALFYANQSLAGFGLPIINPLSPWASVPIWTSVLIELAVPVFLVIRRCRYIGVIIASAFHLVISFDLGQHFYDFTAVLLPLFFLFLPQVSVERLSGLLRKWSLSRTSQVVLATILVSLVVISAVAPTSLSAGILNRIPFVLWIPASLLWLVLLVRSGAANERLTWNPGWGGIAVALALLNGLTPYTEMKTAYGFNMYANLRTAGGETNHLLLGKTLPLRDGYEDPVEIVASSDPGLEAYRDMDYLVAYPQLRRYLSDRPRTSLTYSRGGSTVRVVAAANEAEFSDPGPWWWRFMPLRSIDRHDPPRCQDVFLAAL